MTTPEDRDTWEADETRPSDFTPYSGSSKVPATFHGPARAATDKAREARYAGAINSVAVADSSEQLRDLVDAVMAVADAEVEEATRELRAEVERADEDADQDADATYFEAIKRAKTAAAERDQLRAAILRIERLAQAHAVTARARGRSEVERDWLDVLAIIERAALARVGAADTQPEGAGIPERVWHEWHEDTATHQADLADILRALGLGDHARPYSPHEVVQREVLPALAETWRRRVDTAPESGEGR
jgi:hypothetical protein